MPHPRHPIVAGGAVQPRQGSGRVGLVFPSRSVPNAPPHLLHRADASVAWPSRNQPGQSSAAGVHHAAPAAVVRQVVAPVPSPTPPQPAVSQPQQPAQQQVLENQFQDDGSFLERMLAGHAASAVAASPAKSGAGKAVAKPTTSPAVTTALSQSAQAAVKRAMRRGHSVLKVVRHKSVARPRREANADPAPAGADCLPAVLQHGGCRHPRDVVGIVRCRFQP